MSVDVGLWYMLNSNLFDVICIVRSRKFITLPPISISNLIFSRREFAKTRRFWASCYMVENNVPLSKCSTKVLHSLETNPKKLDLLETLYIRKAASSGKILFNSQLERKVGHELIT